MVQKPNIAIADKIYLQLSTTNFTVGQTIWYKAIVTDSKYHLPSKSGVLYVDLIDSFGNIKEHQLLKLKNGIGTGAIYLKDEYLKGSYLIRAYTRWNLNFDNAFISQSQITIYDDLINDKSSAFNGLKLIKQDSNNHAVVGKFIPKQLGFSDEVKLHLDWTENSDSIIIKKREIGASYQLNYKLEGNPNWINLRLKNKERISDVKTLILNDSLLDVQFFPESGQLISGLPNKIGFKAVGFDSKGKKIRGTVYDDSGNQILKFESNHLGMGFFTMVPSFNATYTAKVSLFSNTKINTIKKIPTAKQYGSILSINKNTDTVNVKVLSNNLQGYFYIKVSCRENDYYLIEGPLRKGQLNTEIPAKGLPHGILVFTLLNERQEPITERLFFNNNKENKLAINVETIKTAYQPREKTTLKVQINEGSRPSINTTLSIMVLNKNLWLKDCENINSFFYLSSELRGEIEKPGYYFDLKADRFNDLEALLLTQGWRNYKYPIKRNSNKFNQLQRALNVSGNLFSTNKKRKPLDQNTISLTTFGKETTIYSQDTDSLGRFNFNLEDNYDNRQRILLSATKSTDSKDKLSLVLNTLKIPQIKFRITPRKENFDSLAQKVISEKINRDKSQKVYDSLSGVTLLDEVIVSDVFLHPNRKKYYEKFGEPDIIIKGEVLRKQEKDWSYGLFSILQSNYGEHIKIEKFSDGFMLAHINAGSKESTLLAVDGRLLQVFEYENVPFMPSEIIEDIELIKYSKNFKNKYLQVFPDADPLNAPGIGHIISIYTKGGVGVTGSGKPIPGTLSTTIDVFTPIKEFYKPKYDTNSTNKGKLPDLRSLIHWEPLIRTDSLGKANIEFFNNDVQGEYLVIIEAISENGKIGYQELNYKIVD
ncbi:hypothetical protein JQC67_13240 [Aurantibacter crassamenti]|uniref:hypothetical protein n=1 Tax=Aurantibacter crassamenti TaxID=1837375 RepID=UPI00193AD3DA|nr:hypothetical protein [Aurantibacter crassamenti]MBM1107111.1 hypothetical protein [Aurantibacter crassamenti]